MAGRRHNAPDYSKRVTKALFFGTDGRDETTETQQPL